MLRCVNAQLLPNSFSNANVMYPPNDTFSIHNLNSSHVSALCEQLRISYISPS